MTHPPENPTTPEPVQAEPVGYLYHWPEDPGRTPYFRRDPLPEQAIGWSNGWTETPLYTRPTPDLAEQIEGLMEALKTTSAWLDRWASHIGACPGNELCECGLTRARYEASTILAALKEMNSHDRT